MFEQLNEPRKAPRVSIAMSLGILSAYLAGAFGGLCLFIVLRGKPFGIQIATAVTYTYFAFWYVFFPTRGLLEKYSLRNRMVQQRIPLLLAIHCAFLISMFLGQAIWFAMESHFTEHGKSGGDLYVMVMIGSIVAVFFTQVLIFRRILSRSLKEDLNEPGSE